MAEIDKKAQELERRGFAEDVDEDDAGKQIEYIFVQSSLIPLGVKRPSESHNPDDGNSNTKNNRSNRNDFRYDGEYNPSKFVLFPLNH